MNNYPHISEGILGEETVAKTNTQLFLDLVEQYFPEAIKDGEVDFTALKEEMGEFPEVGAEHYSFNWAGKQAAKKDAQADVFGRTLRFCPEESVDPENTENLYIEGDNLEVLKMLRRNYHGAVKMIYIDPPYNTGNDFVYRDDFTMSEDELAELSGDVTDGERMQRNTKDNAQYHTKWLNMMCPRLKIARDLLSDDGVIFISIDDNEQENLKKICDEIFGEDNFITDIVWKRKRGRDNSARWFSKSHEYMVVYSKSKSNFDTNYLELDEETKKAYKNPDNDPRGVYRMLGCWARGTQGGVEYDFTTKDGQYFSKRLWLFSKENLQKLDADNKLIIHGDNIYRKMFIFENKGKIPETLWDDTSNAANAADEIKKIFGNIIFDTPKPIPYITQMLNIASDKNSLILDFFSGSATTAHAVMQLNAEDGGKRRFICVQIPEICDEKSEAYKAGYKNICEIGKERIRRAAKKIREDNPDAEFDGGFKVFKTADTTIRWNKLNDSELLEFEKVSENTSTDRIDFTDGYNDIDVVYEIMLRHYNIPLSTPIERLPDIGARTYIFADSVAVCLEQKITNELIERLAAIEPTPAKFILRDSAFGDDITFKDEAFRRLSALIQNHQTEEERRSRYSTYTVEFI